MEFILLYSDTACSQRHGRQYTRQHQNSRLLCVYGIYKSISYVRRPLWKRITERCIGLCNPDSAGKSPILCYIYDNDKSFPKSYEFVTTGDTLKYQLIGPHIDSSRLLQFNDDRVDNRFWGIVTDDSVIVLEYIYEDHPYTYLYDVRQTVLDDSFKEKFSTLGIKAVGYTPPRAKR